MVSSNTLTNIKMTNAIKGIVSKKKKRYKEGGYDLDLTYIRDNIIAMGYPAKNLEGVYRNHVDDVLRLLEAKHNNNYKIYNLCEEKKYQYDSSTFQRTACFPFPDHNPPKIELIQSFCNDVHKWLLEDEKNVAAVHCKAGKGRTGTMICCYLMHSGQYSTAAEALNYYAQSRTTDKKGVTIPSQRRYVEYYSQLLKLNRPYVKVAMNICEIKLHHLPRTFGTLTYSITVQGSKIHSEQLTDIKREKDVENVVSIKLDRCLVLMGDVKIEFSSTQILKHKQKLFHFWFNTFFINEITRVDSDGNVIHELNKPEIDDAHKDKQKMFSENFKIETIFQRIPQGGINHINRMHDMQINNHNTNGILNNVHTRYNNNHHLNNNNTINNNDVNHHHHAAYNNSNSVSIESQNNSENHNHSTTAAYRSASSSRNSYQISCGTNEMRHSRGDNYPTTSEGSSSPESSSDSSEEWESGAQPSCDKFQNELKARLIMKRKRLERRKSNRVRLSSPKISDQIRCNSGSRKYSGSSSVEKNHQSTSANLNCFNAKETVVANDSSDDDDDDDDEQEDKVEKVSSSSSKSNLNLTSLKNRLSTIFHRFAGTESPKESPPFTPIRRNHTFDMLTNYFRYRTNPQINFDDVRNELLTLRQFSEGCDEENQDRIKVLDK